MLALSLNMLALALLRFLDLIPLKISASNLGLFIKFDFFDQI